MRCASFNRPSYKQGSHQGGDDVQRLAHAQYLADYDIEVVFTQEEHLWKEQHFDLAHAYNVGLTESHQACLAAKERGIPLVVNSIYTPGFFGAGKSGAIEVLGYASAIICNIPQTGSEMERDLGVGEGAFQGKTFHIPAGAHPDWYLRKPDYLYLPPEFQEGFHVVFPARYDDRKAQDGYLAAWLKVGMGESGVHLWITGDERHPVYGRCLELAKGVPTVHVLGPQPYDQVWQWMAAASVVVQATHYDNPGLVLIESAMLGTDCVSTNIPEITGYFKDLVRYGEKDYPDTHVAKTKEALEDVLLRGGKKNIPLANFCLRNYRWDLISFDLAEVYRWVLGQGPEPSHTWEVV